MKRTLILSAIVLLYSSQLFSQQNVGIGTSDPDDSAILEMQTTSQGMLPPRLTYDQRQAISNPATGLILWCSDCGSNGELQVFNGEIWTNFLGGIALRKNDFNSTQLGSSIDGSGNYDQFGRSVSISSDGLRLAIGNNKGKGRVGVYEWNNTSWIQLGTSIEGDDSGDIAGEVSLSGDGSRLAIGAQYHDQWKGQVRIFDWNGSAWVQVGSDIDGSPNDRSGYAISLSSDGTHIAVGAHLSGNKKGYVKIFEYSGGSWIQKGNTLEGSVANEEYGYAISISASGSIVAIGARGHENETGRAQIYQWQNSAWTQMGSDIEGMTEGDQNGSAITITANGHRVAISAIEFDSEKGTVIIYDWSGAEWIKAGNQIIGNASEELGHSVSISADGSRLAVGSVFANNTKGLCNIYDWNGSAWLQTGTTIYGVSNFDGSGHDISLSSDGNVIAIGAPFVGTQVGHVRVFN